MNRGQKVLFGCAIAAGVFIALSVASVVAVTAQTSARTPTGTGKYTGLTQKQINLIESYYEECENDNQFVPSRAHDCNVENAKLIQQFLEINKKNANLS